MLVPEVDPGWLVPTADVHDLRTARVEPASGWGVKGARYLAADRVQ